jgi:alpha-L-rhamnosidase
MHITARSLRRPSRLVAIPLSVVLAVTALPGLGLAGPASAAPGSALPWPSSPDWQQYEQAPASPVVYPASVTDVQGDVTNPSALTDPATGGTTTLSVPVPHNSGPDYWPHGTTASASSTHASSGKTTYSAQNALDGNPATYWNSAVAGKTDWLQIASPSPVTLPGLTFLSSPDGVPVDFQIQTWNASTGSWVTQARVTGNSSVQVAQKFPAPVTTSKARIYITKNQSTKYGAYSRIAEVYPSSLPAGSLVLDYGQEINGWPEFDVTHSSGSPELVAGYSEARQFLTPLGDGANSGGPGVNDPYHYDVYDVAGPGVIASQFVQGGQRYQELSLLTPGTVSLSFARMRYARYLPSSSDESQAYFVSSDQLLNKLWYDGAWTVDLDQLPQGTPTADWVANDGSVTIDGGVSDGTTPDGGSGILRTGQAWTNYTMKFQASIMSGQAGWLVRAHGFTSDDGLTSGYLLILDANDDTSGPPDSLQELAYSGGTYHGIATVRMPFAVSPDTWYQVQTVASGTTVTTYVSNKKVASFSSASFAAGVPRLSSGTVGFREGGSVSAEFKDLVVKTASGQYQNQLSQQADVSAFELPAWNPQVPLMMAAAKREGDEGVWSGDLSVEGPTDYYAVDDPQYLKGAIELLGSYQLTSGFVPGYKPGNTPVHTGNLICILSGKPPKCETVTQYSASYSMYWVVDLAEYYEFTGDTAFVQKEWPIVQREVSFTEGQPKVDGLLETNSADGWDWHYNDLTGEQTYDNALYYQSLLDAATLAPVAGHGSLAAGYRSTAQALKSAINAHLFDDKAGYYDVSVGQAGPVAQDANVYALLLGLAPPGQAAGIVNALEKDLSTPYGALDVSSPAPAGYGQLIGPFMGSYELWALLADGDTSDALSLMNAEWGPMTTQGTGDTFWEWLTPDGQIKNGPISLAHGWSTGPTSALSQYILGVAPASAGFKTWLVAPQPGTLSWVEGKVPTPQGPVTVKWGQQAGTFTMDVQAPASTTGTITVPGSSSPDITVNGHLVWSDGKFRAAPGVTGARLAGQNVDLTVTPKAAPGGFLVTSQKASATAS